MVPQKQSSIAGLAETATVPKLRAPVIQDCRAQHARFDTLFLGPEFGSVLKKSRVLRKPFPQIARQAAIDDEVLFTLKKQFSDGDRNHRNDAGNRPKQLACKTLHLMV